MTVYVQVYVSNDVMAVGGPAGGLAGGPPKLGLSLFISHNSLVYAVGYHLIWLSLLARL